MLDRINNFLYFMMMENDSQVISGENKGSTEKSNKALWIAIGIISLLVVVGGIFLLAKSGSDNTANLTPTPMAPTAIPTFFPTHEPTPSSASPSASPIPSSSATPKITTKPSPTISNVQGLQANPTQQPTPTQLPLQ